MPAPDLGSIRHWHYWDSQLPVWYDAEFRLPLTGFGKRWGFEPRRADLVAWYLLERKWIRRANLRSPARARYEELGRVHTDAYLARLTTQEMLAQILGVDPWDVPVDEVMRSIRLGVGATLAAARESLARDGPTVNLFGGFHHAGPDWGSGLCALNDMAVAVATLRHEGFGGRVVVLDLDAHPPDGTAACLGNDRGVWIGSLSGGASTAIAGADETVLPAGCDDATYLAALEGLLGRMPRADLALVVAGGDVLAGDRLGGLGLSLEGARRRDQTVVKALHGTPSVWLPGGGYHPKSWHVLAGTVLVLLRHTRQPLRPGDDPLSMRFARLAKHLRAHHPRESTDLSLADIESQLGVASDTRHLLLGIYTAEAIEYALHRFNLLGFLERRGYGHFRVALGTASNGAERVCLFGEADGHEYLLADCALQRRKVGEAPMLYVHWLSLRDPRARFSDLRPRLPGQEVPGLGLVREAAELLTLAARRLGVAGVAFTPAWYHTAYVSRERFRFVDAGRQGRFEAMVRDLAGFSLSEVSTAMAGGRVRLNGDPYAWEAEDMAWWWREAPDDGPAVAAAREQSAFTVDPSPGSEATVAGPS